MGVDFPPKLFYELMLYIFFPGRPGRLVLWTVAFLVSMALFAYWHRVAQAAQKDSGPKGPAS